MKLTYLIELDLDPASDLAGENVLVHELESHLDSLHGVERVEVTRVHLESLEAVVRYER